MSAGGAPLVALIILDGWGCAPPGPGNAVSLAETPVFDRLWETWSHTTLDASGEAAGLPPGQMGNSEVGHLTIGAGRRLYQDLQRVNAAIADGSFFESPVLRVGLRARASRAPARARLGGRSPFARRPPARAAPLRAGEDVDPRLHRRTRRLAARGDPRPRDPAAGSDRDRRRPVLRDGPRPALGADAAGLRRADGRHGSADRERARSGAGELRRRRSPTSSSSRSSSTARRGSRPGTASSSSTSAPTEPGSSRSGCSRPASTS